jgi:hypothetical protein
MLVDAFLPEGFTRLAVDSIFMMPQLGVLSTVHRKAATEVFRKDCLIHLGTCICPVGTAKKYGSECLKATIRFDSGKTETVTIRYGELARVPLDLNETAEVSVDVSRSFDLGEGKGKRVVRKVSGGTTGIIFDCRGRPFELPTSDSDRVAKLKEWLNVLDVYPKLD